jgi:hypothetical protein
LQGSGDKNSKLKNNPSSKSFVSSQS